MDNLAPIADIGPESDKSPDANTEIDSSEIAGHEEIHLPVFNNGENVMNVPDVTRRTRGGRVINLPSRFRDN